MAEENDNLKLRTARSMKWNVIDRVLSQVLYAVTGIVLARELSEADFGLVGVVLIFQAFATLFADSGFSYALIQSKAPTRLDYSSVLWFNMIMAAGIYAVLWFAAPSIAVYFENDQRIIPLLRVMLIAFILNAASIVQTNRFMKQMNVRPIAVSNAVALSCGAVTGIWLAVKGWGAWAIVWQTIVTNGVKTLILWAVSRWIPMFRISWAALRSFMSVGVGMMFTSFLNTVFLQIYSFFIGHKVGFVALGYYTQSDKWSKMGVTSITQALTSTFVPALSAIQDDKERFRRLIRKMNRMTAYLVFPAMLGLAAVATPLFHTLFGAKWDASILLFQIMLVRGVFLVLTSLYTNYLLALGLSKRILTIEIVKDTVSLAALVATLPVIAVSLPGNPVYGVTIMLLAQLGASVAAWITALCMTARATRVNGFAFLADNVPYLALSGIMCVLIYPLLVSGLPDWLVLAAMITAGGLFYLGANGLMRSKIQADAIAYVRGRL